jgi:integrase
MGLKYTDEKVRTKISALIREDLEDQGLDPDVRPTQKWLRDNGYSGIEGYARRNDMTVTEVLEEMCGFDPPGPKPLGINHGPTKQSIKAWLDFEDEISYQWDDSRIDDARSHIRKISSVSAEALGTSNLFCLLEGDDEATSQKILQLFYALREELDQGSQSNYTYTLERWANFLEATNRIEDHSIGDIRELMGWSFKRRSPEHHLRIGQVRDLWQARESLEEAALLTILASTGGRRREPTDIKVSQLRLDRADPYIVFGEERKTGPGTVPIMAGAEIIEKWIEKLKTREWWDGEWLFPSKKSEDGSRPKGWVNRVIDDIAERADVTFPDDSKITPKHFRSFWYTHYAEARQAWLTELDRLAKKQGVSSGEVIDKHYLSDQAGRDHFRRFVESAFEPIFGDGVHGIDAVAEKRAEERDSDVNRKLKSYVESQVADEIAANNDSSHESPAAIEPVSPWVKAKLLADHAAYAASEKLDNYPPSRWQATKLTVIGLVWAIAFGLIWAWQNVLYINPFTGSYHITSGAAIGLVFGMVYIFIQIRELLDLPIKRIEIPQLNNLASGAVVGVVIGHLKKMRMKMENDPELVDPTPRNFARVAGLVLLGGVVLTVAAAMSPASPMKTAVLYATAVPIGTAKAYWDLFAGDG